MPQSYGCITVQVALRKESVDRNSGGAGQLIKSSMSLSARRAWIEIFRPPPQVKPVRVALRKESVDRNIFPPVDTSSVNVALRKESVDRNAFLKLLATLILEVALRKESVDRNLYYGDDLTFSDVALRKESVDRNSKIAKKVLTSMYSRSPQGERG